MCKNIEWTETEDGRLAFVDKKSGILIVNPFESTCGRFDVDPVEAYDVDVETAKDMVIFNGSIRIDML